MRTGAGVFIYRRLFQGCHEGEVLSGARNFVLGSTFGGKEFRLSLLLQLLT
jgi:hypothetical protein